MVVEDGSDDSDDDAPGLDGELTEEQKKVAEAAGLGDQMDKQVKQSRSEKKVCFHDYRRNSNTMCAMFP